jgi:CheY-like chemotaxis protein
MGCAATFVTDSSKAIAAADAMKAEIVFLDIGMPEDLIDRLTQAWLDGYGMLRRSGGFRPAV